MPKYFHSRATLIAHNFVSQKERSPFFSYCAIVFAFAEGSVLWVGGPAIFFREACVLLAYAGICCRQRVSPLQLPGLVQTLADVAGLVLWHKRGSF